MHGTRILVDWDIREIRIADAYPDASRILWSLMFDKFTGVFGVEKMAFMLADNQEVDADLGTGTRDLTGILDVDVVGGEAVAIEIIPSEPTTQG